MQSYMIYTVQVAMVNTQKYEYITDSSLETFILSVRARGTEVAS